MIDRRRLATVCALALVAALASASTVSPARAEILDDPTNACKTRAVADKVYALSESDDAGALKKYVDRQTRGGDCKLLPAHATVTVETRAPNLACVRGKTDTRCVWTLESALRSLSDKTETVQRDYVACRDDLYLETGRKIIASGNAEALKRFQTATNLSGICFALRRGDKVRVEKRKNQTICVRARGEDDCFWTDAIVLKAP